MKILIVKTSSMGDIIHTLPAVTDAARAIPGIQMDWVVEEAFAEISQWHPAIRHVIPIAIRRWRNRPLATLRSEEWKQFRSRLKQEHYDYVIDAQGLVKSALVSCLARGRVYGFDWASAREPLASLAYQQNFFVDKNQHAVERTRSLFGQVLGYRPDGNSHAGLRREQFGSPDKNKPFILFLHGTTRGPKHWPDEYWVQLCTFVTGAGFCVKIPWYNDEEKRRAEKIAAASDRAEVLPKSNLQGMASALAQAHAFVAVDTGLGHLGAALEVPGISLYGPTSPVYVGAHGKNQMHINAGTGNGPAQEKDLLSNLVPEDVWRALQKLPSL